MFFGLSKNADFFVQSSFPVLAIAKRTHFRKSEEGYNQTGRLESKCQVMVMGCVIAAMICVIAVWIGSQQLIL